MTSLPEFEGWLAHGWGIEAKAPAQALDLISHIALLAQGRTYAWRGQNDATYKLSSSLYRRLENTGTPVTENALRAEENKILEEARRWGLAGISDRQQRTSTCWLSSSTTAYPRVCLTSLRTR